MSTHRSDRFSLVPFSVYAAVATAFVFIVLILAGEMCMPSLYPCTVGANGELGIAMPTSGAGAVEPGFPV